MVPGSSHERPVDAAGGRELLDIAARSIRHGLDHGRPLPVDAGKYAAPLGDRLACFVTLHRQGRLRGCIGHLEAVQALVSDVADNAYAAAFNDPRFPPLQRSELDDLDLEISVLTPPRPMRFDSEQDLLTQLVPGEDGLILEEGTRRGTFLPSVWSSLPDVESFVRELKRKAGLPADYWSDSVRVARYHTQSIV